MKKIIVSNEVVNAFAEEVIIREHEKKAKREIKKNRVKELMAQGIEKDVAEVMASVGL